MKLFAVLLLLLGMFSLSVAEVVDSFKKTCPQFFIKDNNNQAVPPTVLKGSQYKQICQFYDNTYWFATLYHTQSKIPVYSAYTYSFPEPFTKKGVSWMIEPQLDETWTDKNKEMKLLKPEEEEMLWKQAQNKDYDDSDYTKGHLFPKSYGKDKKQTESTHTLTNAAPQTEEINSKWGERVEIPMLNKIKGNCDQNSPVYIVTGVVPDENKWLEIHRKKLTIKQGVNIPSHFWTAYSCKSKNNNNIESNAYIAEQITPLVPENLTVDALNQKLRLLYNTNDFSVFGKIKHK